VSEEGQTGGKGCSIIEVVESIVGGCFGGWFVGEVGAAVVGYDGVGVGGYEVVGPAAGSVSVGEDVSPESFAVVGCG